MQASLTWGANLGNTLPAWTTLPCSRQAIRKRDLIMRALGAMVILAAVAITLLVVSGSQPYPYPVAYKFGYQYREESLKEEGWQAQFHAQNAFAHGTVQLTRFWPRFADTEQGALACWRERRKTAPIPYLDSRTAARREPTAAETRLEKEGWVAGYMESTRRHPKPGG
jgi:hypothetical protein